MKFKRLQTFAFALFAVNLFVVLPLIKLQISLDPGLALRFLLCSLLMGMFSLIWIIRPPQYIFLSSKFLVFLGLLLFTLLWMTVSGFQSINAGDALWEFIRVTILFLFCISFCLLFQDVENGVEYLGRFSMAAIVIFSTYGFYQLGTDWNAAHSSGKLYQMNLFIGSSLGNKNFFAEVMVMLIPLQAINFYRQGGTWKFVFAIGLILCLLWVIILQSFSSWLALLVAGIIAPLYTGIYKFRKKQSLESAYRRKPFLFAFLVLTGLVIVSFVFVRSDGVQTITNKSKLITQYIDHPELIDSTSGINDNSVFERILSWRNSVRLINDHPFLGAGLNNWKLLHAQYGLGGTPFINTGMIHFEHPHNDYLLIWSEQGPVGLLLYLAFFFFLLHTARSSILLAKEKETRNLMFWIVFGLLSFAVLSCFAYPRSRIYVMLLLMLYAALVLVYAPFTGKKFLVDNRRRLSLGLIGLFISCFGVYAAWARLKGEIHTQELLRAQYAKNYARMIKEASKAESFMYPMDLTGTPMSWYKGMACFYSGKIQEAISYYESAEKINPYHLRVLNDLATSYEQDGQGQKAIEKYRAGLRIAPNFIEGLLNLSATYYNTGQLDSAFAVISRIRKYKISVQDEQNYKLFLNAILLSKARIHLESLNKNGAMDNKKIIVPEDLDLEALFLSSVKYGKSFEEEIDGQLKTELQKL